MRFKTLSATQREIEKTKRKIERRTRLHPWRNFFCLKPRRVDDNTIVWLENIQCRLDPNYNGDWISAHMQYRTYQQALQDK